AEGTGSLWHDVRWDGEERVGHPGVTVVGELGVELANPEALPHCVPSIHRQQTRPNQSGQHVITELHLTEFSQQHQHSRAGRGHREVGNSPTRCEWRRTRRDLDLLPIAIGDRPVSPYWPSTYTDHERLRMRPIANLLPHLAHELAQQLGR